MEQGNESERRLVTLSEVKTFLSGKSANNKVSSSSNSNSEHVCFMLTIVDKSEPSSHNNNTKKLNHLITIKSSENMDCNPSFIALNATKLTYKPQLPINFDINLPHVNMSISQSKEAQFHIISKSYYHCFIFASIHCDFILQCNILQWQDVCK